jgi:YesN/AraC family two-component response regulator
MKKILLVDDHPLIRLGIRSTLDGNYEICGEAANGADAVGKAAALTPDLILMDVNMPVMDGLGAARRIGRCCRTQKSSCSPSTMPATSQLGPKPLTQF